MEQKEKKLCEKKKTKQNVQEAGWATTHLPVMVHDTGNCIVTQSWGCKPGRAIGGVTRSSWRTAGRCDTARRPCDTTGLRVGRAALARAWPGRWGCVTIQMGIS